ncbi:MAG: PQQ-dependent sugar dehydrogenase [Chloroflexi bacterium]|nr:PQQ-dependent sugar dehydrogenase [Chloroflexota bacterium]
MFSEAQMANSNLKPQQVGGHAVNLPAGFTMSVVASGLSVPRFMAFDSGGNLVIAEDGANRIVVLAGGTGAPKTLISGLGDPTSVALYQNYLYVAEAGQVSRYTYANGAATNRQVVIPNLPAATDHHTRTVVFGPDGSLYLAMGSPCDACVPNDARYATIGRYAADGSAYQLVAKGLRNAVGLAFRPGTDELWATVMGRDGQGNDVPWDLLTNIRAGGDYGWPRCYDNKTLDPQFGQAGACNNMTLPDAGIQAHSAPLGLSFYNGKQFPTEYQGDAFIGLHGSWNRTVTVGYKVVRAHFEGGKVTSVQDFATGWRADSPGTTIQTPYGFGTSGAWGRPVDPVVAPDGSLYLSDDYGGMIYRIAYSG